MRLGGRVLVGGRVLAAVAVAAALLAACGGDDDDGGGGSGSASALRTVKSGMLTVCSDVPYAPFEFEQGGQTVGIDADLMKAIATELGLQASFRDTDFDGIFAALAAGQCDTIASAVSITEERQKSNEFTQGYFEIQQSLLVRKEDATRYRTLDDLRGRPIGAQSETTGEAYAKSHLPAGASLRSFTGADEAFTALRARQIDGIVQDFPVNAYNAQSTGETVVAAKLPSDPERYGFVVKKGNTKLRDAIDGALTTLRQRGTYGEILKRYTGEAAP